MSSTPIKEGSGTPQKSSFLTPCRRMGLKRRSVPSASLALTPMKSPLPESPLAKRAPEESLAATPLDSTPKRRFHPKRKSLNVTRVEKPTTENEPEAEPPKLSVTVNALEVSIASKQKQIALLKKGIHPMQMDVDRLNKLTDVWRSGCQRALQDLLEMMHKNSEEAAKVLTMDILISNLDVPADLLHFDSTNEEFY